MIRVDLWRAVSILSALFVAVPLALGDDEKPPETHAVTPGPFQVQVDLEGIFESEQMTEVILRPEVFASLEVEKAVPQGTKVAAGDPILWLETEDIDEQLRNAEFDLQQAKLTFAQSE